MKSPATRHEGRLIVFVAAIVCLLFTGTLFDVRAKAPPPLATIPAPPVPDAIQDRDAAMVVSVVDEQGNLLPGASVRVFAIRGSATYFAGDKPSDGSGQARFTGLPRGEAWVLVYGAGRARASTRVILDAGEREARVVLRSAVALDVVVVDESDEPIEGAEVKVFTGDPLPSLAFTSSSGAARLDRLGPPPFLVRAWLRGYEESVRTGVVPGAGPLRIKLERLGAFAVKVIGKDGEPAPGATVLTAGSGLWPARSTLTDATGSARIAGLRAGVYDLKARLGDDVSATEFAVPIKRGEVQEVRLMLVTGRWVVVTVTDGEAEDAPAIKDASVVLVEEGLSPFPLQGRTDGKGIVSLGPIAAGNATVSASAEGFVPRSAVSVGELDTEARISLERGGALVGDVVDDRGFPVDGATIEVVGVDPQGMPINETTAMSDFREDHFAFALSGPAPLIPMGELGVMPGPIPDLPHEGSIEALGAGMRVPRSGGGGGDPWVTRRDGTFRAEPIPPGRVHAIVRHPAYIEGVSETVTIRSGAESTVHVVLRQGGSLEGRIIEADRRPVAGARVEIAATQGSLERVTYTADDGTFAFAAVPAEVILSVARPETPADVVARLVLEIPDRERKEIEVMLPTLRDSVSIHIVDSRGYPIDRVEVRVMALDLEVPLRRTLFTNDDGDAVLPDAAGLPLRIAMLRPTKAPRVEIVDSAATELVFELAEGITARGVVTARDGRDRIEGADVTLYTPSGARHRVSDEEGAFVFEDLAPGRVRVVVSHTEHAPTEAWMNVGADPAGVDLGEIDLSEAGEAEGVVLDANDDPVPGARVARDAVPTYLPLGPLPPGVVATDRDGRFTLKGLPEGEVTLAAYSAELGRGFANGVPIRAGRTTSRITINLPDDEPSAREPKGAGSVAVTLGERTEAGSRAVIVVMVPPGSEAEVSGIEPGDRLITVNGRQVGTIEAARKGLTGPLSSDVLLQLGRAAPPGGQPREWLVRVRRERVRR